VTETDAAHRATQELIRKYVLKNFTGNINGQRPRVLLFGFSWSDAVEKIHAPSDISCTSERAAKRFATRSAITSPMAPANDLL